MKKVKITVLKKNFDKELAAEYGVEGLTACPMLKEGQVFYADYAKPEGLCDEALLRSPVLSNDALVLVATSSISWILFLKSSPLVSI